MGRAQNRVGDLFGGNDGNAQAPSLVGRSFAEEARIDDTRELRDHPVRNIEDATGFVRKHALRSFRIEGVRRDEKWSIPLPAVREAIINAVTHSDYSQMGAPIRVSVFDDRVEIESPGLLPFGLTVADILRGVSRLRNRVIGRVFKELGLIEQWGSGVGRMVDSCREHGLPPPEFEEVATHFRVTFRLQPAARPEFDAMTRTILDAIRKANGLSTKGVAEAVGISPRAARTRLKALVDRELIVEVGSSPTDPKRIYMSVDGGRPAVL